MKNMERGTNCATYNPPERSGIVQITYSNVFIIGNKQIPFDEFSEEQKKELGNHMRKIPLETLGEVKRRKSA